MLPLALLLCSLVRALPSRCHANDYENVDQTHVDPLDAAKVTPIGNALYAPEPEPTAQASTSGSAGSDSGVAPVTAPKHDSAARVSSSGNDEEGSRVRPSTDTAGDTDLSASAKAPAPPAGDCKCGYILSAHSNAYFPSAHIVNFASLPQGPLQISDLSALGFEVNNQWQVGGAYQGTRSVGFINALSGLHGALALTVKGGQRMGGDIEAAEVIFQPEGGMTGGVFSMEAMLDDTPGTCQSIVGPARIDKLAGWDVMKQQLIDQFTYNLLQGAPGDEQDIEILGQTIFGKMENGTPPGVQLTNHDVRSLLLPFSILQIQGCTNLSERLAS